MPVRYAPAAAAIWCAAYRRGWVRRMIAEREAALADAEAIGDAYAARQAEHELHNYRQFLARLEPQKE